MQKRDDGDKTVFPRRHGFLTRNIRTGNFPESESDKTDNRQRNQNNGDYRFSPKFAPHGRSDRVKTRFRKRTQAILRKRSQKQGMFFIVYIASFHDITQFSGRLENNISER